jgi:hypothetical protein
MASRFNVDEAQEQLEGRYYEVIEPALSLGPIAWYKPAAPAVPAAPSDTPSFPRLVQASRAEFERKSAELFMQTPY